MVSLIIQRFIITFNVESKTAYKNGNNNNKMY
jgi:hypothetical protein